VLWKMRLDFFFCIKDVLHFGYDNSITERFSNLFKCLLGFILIKLLQYRICGRQFIVMCFDELCDLCSIFLGPHSFCLFILLLLFASPLDCALCVDWLSRLNTQSLFKCSCT
jgi:hypothetical protein